MLILLQSLDSTDGQNSSEGTSSQAEEKIELLVKSASDVVSMEVKNEHGTFLLKPDPSQETKEGEDPDFTIETLEGATLSLPKMSVITPYAYNLLATRDLGEMTDLSAYGLVKPQAEITVKFSDSSEFSYAIGDKTPTTGYYARIGKDKNVYIVDAHEVLFNSKFDFVDTDVLEIPVPEDSAGGYNVYSKLVFSGTNFPDKIVIDNNSPDLLSTYRATEPIEIACSEDVISALVTSLEDIKAESVAAVNPTQKELEEFGLAEPETKLEFTVNEEDHVLVAGKKQEDYRYIMVDDVKTVYLVKNENVELWADTDFFTLRQSFIMLIGINRIEKLSIESSDAAHTFSFSRTINKEKTTDEETVYDYTVTGTDGQKLVYESVQNFYKTLVELRLFDDTEEEIQGKPYMTITYKCYDGEKYVVKLYESSEERRYVAAVDDYVLGTIKETSVTELLSAAAQIETETE